ncbi:DUF6708 domain-containing protein [Herbaspirillum huttiense]|uniref:DUF6708 domain-containing protein n=1 Tax=Herbaspirillum huttiense TaxID=863372 RepID=UPI0039B0FD1D
MDERVFSYKEGSPIPAWDLQHRLSIHQPASSERKDTGTIFRINATYMDVTDQPYRDRHWQAGGVLVSCIATFSPLWLVAYTLLHPLKEFSLGLVIADLIFVGAAGIFGYLTFKYGRDEFLSLTRRPVRFNRKEKKLYAVRRRRFLLKPGQGDITWEVPWNEQAIFCIHRSRVRHRNVYHIRYYEVDQNDKVTRAFAIGRTWEEDESLEDLLSQWNYWCWYMNHGPADLPKPLLFFKERENMLESFLFCMYGFGMRGSVAHRIAMMPFILLMTSHRLMALWTCRDPIWPDSVTKVSVIEPDDPFDQPSGHTPVGWAKTAHAIDRSEYPDGDKREMKNWSGEKNPSVIC